jgi:hypothetical protein
MSYIVFNSLVALFAGVAILVKPAILNYVVAFYLILVGSAGLILNLI